MSAVEWLVGFVTFIAVAVAIQIGINVALDAWWVADGLDPASRPSNAAIEWLISGAAGLAAGWGVTQLFGDD